MSNNLKITHRGLKDEKTSDCSSPTIWLEFANTRIELLGKWRMSHPKKRRSKIKSEVGNLSFVCVYFLCSGPNMSQPKQTHTKKNPTQNGIKSVKFGLFILEKVQGQ